MPGLDGALYSSTPCSLALFFFLALLLPVGCAVQPLNAVTSQSVEVAFSPEAGAEALVVKVLASAQQTIRLAGYSFTSPAVVKGLVEAKRRGVDVKVLLDDRGNRGQASLVAMRMITEANIPLRVISAYAIHHDKYIVVDSRHTETGSFNYSQAAARSISENVLVVWNNPATAQRFFQHWESRWKQGIEVERQ